MRADRFFAGLVLFLVFVGRAQADPVRVAAAANLQQVFTQALIPAFQHQTGIRVEPTFGATKLLATQLENGAPVDVFVSADTKTVDRLVAKGLLVGATERVYAIGRLALWSRADAPHHPKRLEDLADFAYANIAIANPKLAPYGQAAVESLAHAGLSASTSGRLVQAENIGQALQYARSGNADVALTSLSLVVRDKTDPYVIVPDSYHKPIRQSLALVQGAKNPAAQRWIQFLTGPTAAPIWKQYGYALPPVGK